LVPVGYQPEQPLPLVVMLHGAGGDAPGALAPFVARAEEAGLVLLAPESRGRTWDVLEGGYGEDVAFIGRAVGHVTRRVAIDPRRVIIEGFSDGASYALGLGLYNGDLFGHVVAFSPGFVPAGERVGRPRVFLSHGVDDRVLPIDRGSRRLVPELRRRGYDVRYVEFPEGHVVPPAIADEALAWLQSA
jgi:phospholipase/carboxylesterase